MTVKNTNNINRIGIFILLKITSMIIMKNETPCTETLIHITTGGTSPASVFSIDQKTTGVKML